MRAEEDRPAVIRARERCDFAGTLLVAIPELVQSEEVKLRVSRLMDDIANLDFALRKVK